MDKWLGSETRKDIADLGRVSLGCEPLLDAPRHDGEQAVLSIRTSLSVDRVVIVDDSDSIHTQGNRKARATSRTGQAPIFLRPASLLYFERKGAASG